MTDADGAEHPDVHSIVKPRLDKRIDEILELAKTERVAAIRAARRLRYWLQRQTAAGKSTRDLSDVLREVDHPIDILQTM